MIASSLENIIDKVIIIKKPGNVDILCAMFFRNLGFFVCIVLIGLTGLIGKMSFVFNIPILILVIVYPAVSFSYDHFLRNYEVSRFSSILHILPLFFLFFDNLFFHYSYSLIQLIGIFLLVFGSLLFSYNIKKNKSAFSWKGILLLFAFLVVEIYLYIIFKITSETINGVSFFASVWSMMMIEYVLLLIITKKYKKLQVTATSNGFLLNTFIAKSFDSLSSVFYMQALSVATLTAVSAFISLSPLVMLVILLCIYFLTNIKISEDFSQETLTLKIFATIILILGSLFMFM
jgi:drug/metabolite transporter (DMT)-like permease